MTSDCITVNGQLLHGVSGIYVLDINQIRLFQTVAYEMGVLT